MLDFKRLKFVKEMNKFKKISAIEFLKGQKYNHSVRSVEKNEVYQLIVYE